LWLAGTELAVHAEVRARVPYQPALAGTPAEGRTLRAALSTSVERPIGESRLVTSMSAAGVVARASAVLPSQELVFVGGPTSAPGYAYHSFASTFGATAHVEWRTPAPFVPFSLGRFGRVPSRGAFAPYVHAVVIGAPVAGCARGGLATVAALSACSSAEAGVYPSLGAAYLLPFDLVRIDVARGLARGGRWTFSVDVSREFWSIL
jgi:hypothetical protein